MFKPVEDWDAWDCFWAGGRCDDCGDWVAACACGDWGCNLSSHDALFCKGQRPDDLIENPMAPCTCGHVAQKHRNDRSCCCDVTVVACKCADFEPSLI